MDNELHGEPITARLEREILKACYDVFPDELQSAEASTLWHRVAEITGDTVHYALGGQRLFYEALDRLSRRGSIVVQRGTAGMFAAKITEAGIKELARHSE
jgi:hypothetical protein